MHDRDAINLCWKEQKRPSLAPDSARFVASTCEKMEQDFHDKWNREP